MSDTQPSTLEGKYPLFAAPETFLKLFEGRACYSDICKFVRRVDNDTGIPFLTAEEYEQAKHVLPPAFLGYYENTGMISKKGGRVYLRGEQYYLNLNPRLIAIERKDHGIAGIALSLLEEALRRTAALGSEIASGAQNARSLEERMVVGTLLDLYKNHLMVLFTGLYESMKIDSKIEVAHYDLVRSRIESIIDDYYRFIIQGKVPRTFISQEKFVPVIDVVRRVVEQTKEVYNHRRYLEREFDHPARMVLYAVHLLSQIRARGKKYDLLVNLLNGSAEMGLAIQTIDRILGIGAIASTSIFEVDFARYSVKDRKDKDVSGYAEFEDAAIPVQLREVFRHRIKDKDTLVVDDNLNTGRTLSNVKIALEEVARSVDISTAEIVPIERINELIIKEEPTAKPSEKIILVSSDLTYTPIGWWRDRPEIIGTGTIEKIIKAES